MNIKVYIMDFTHKKYIRKKKAHTQKQRREIHTNNTVDDRFDKAFYFRFHKCQIA